jgi:hypothetical protein
MKRLACCGSAVLAWCLAAAKWQELPEPNWIQVTGRAAWAPRDSCGELAFRGRIWLIGGWFQSFEDPPRDVWSSADGIQWTRATARAAFQHTDLPTTLVFADKMWIMGGWHGGRLKHASASNQVWCSTDGVDWQTVTAAAAWSPRLGAAGVVFQDKMWLLGGVRQYYFGDDRDLLNDVWYSADGATWTQATDRAPWATRAYHAALVHDNKIWVFGGGNYLPHYAAHNDVWSSPDGVHWTQVTEHAPWSPRIWFSAEVYRGRMWVLGGWSNLPSKNWNDVWHSTDGKAWTPLQTQTVWSPRHEHSAYVFQDKLWVAGGNASPLVNDVWQLCLPDGK